MYHTTFVFAILALYVFCSCIEKSNSLRIGSLLIHAYCELVLLLILCLHSTSCSIFNLIVSYIKAFHFNAPHLFVFFRQRNLYLVQGCEVLPMRRCASPMVNTGRVTFTYTFFAINLMKLSFLPVENHKRARFHFMYIYKYYIILMRNPFTFCCLPDNYEPYVPFYTFCICCFS